MVTSIKRPLIISFSIIFGSGILAAIGLYVLVGTISATADKIVVDAALINEQTGALSVMAALKEQAPQATAYQAAIEELLPTQDGLIDFSQWIAGSASQNQVSASVSFNSNSTVPASVVVAGQTGFSLAVTGSLNNIIAFLNSIESQSPGFLLQIKSFDLTNTNGSYQWNGQGVVFFRQ